MGKRSRLTLLTRPSLLLAGMVVLATLPWGLSRGLSAQDLGPGHGALRKVVPPAGAKSLLRGEPSELPGLKPGKHSLLSRGLAKPPKGSGERPFPKGTPRKGDGQGAGVTLCEACTVVPLACGGTVAGSLAAGDCSLPDESFIDFYEVVVPPGKSIEIRLTSAAFDAFLFYVDSTCGVVAQNDDCAPANTNSCIFFLPIPGTYFIGANSFSAGQTGNYTLQVTCSDNTLCGDCAVGNIDCGAARAGRLEAGDCTLSDGRLRDLYQIELTTTSLLELRASSAAFDATLTVFDAGCSVVAFGDDCSDTDTNPCPSVTLDPGVYFLSVSTFDPGEAGNYTIQVICPDITLCRDCEVGALPCDGVPVSGNLPGTACLRPGGAPIDVYRFDVPAVAEVSLSVTSAAFDPHLVIIDSTCVPGRTSEACGEDPSGACLTFRPLLPGTYFVGVSSSAPGGAGAYEIRATCEPFVFCDCDLGQIGCDEQVSGALQPGDCTLPQDGTFIDAWSFELSTAQRVGIELTSTAFDAFLFVLDAECEPIAEADDCGATGSPNPCPVFDLPPGTYFLLANSFSPASGAYDLRVSCMDIPFCRDCRVGSIACGRTVEGALERGFCSLADGSYVEMHELTLPQATEVDIQLSAAFDTFLLIFDSSCVPLASNDDCAEGNTDSCLSIGLPAGTYFVAANSFAAATVGPYTLRVDATDCDVCAGCQAGTISCDAPVTGTLGPGDCSSEGGGPVDTWTLEVAVEAPLVITLESNDFDPVLRVLDASCTLVEENDDCDPNTLGSCVRRTLPAGTYSIAATSFFPNATGTYTLRVSCGSPSQLPGDSNQDGNLDIGDPVHLLGYLFLGDPASLACGDGSSTDPANLMLLDFEGGGVVDLSDAIATLSWLFLDSPPHVLGQTCVPIEGCAAKCTP